MKNKKNNSERPSVQTSASGTKNKFSVRYAATVGILAAAAFLLQILGTIIPFKVGGFLEVEFSDLPAIIGTFSMGPLCGVLIEFFKNLIKCAFTTTGFVGELANFIINGIFVLTAGMIYRRKRTIGGAVLGLAAAVIAMSAAGIFTNLYVLLPLYMPAADLSQKLGIVLSVITPFNVVKGAVLSVVTFFVYKPLSPIIKGK